MKKNILELRICHTSNKFLDAVFYGNCARIDEIKNLQKKAMREPFLGQVREIIEDH